MVTADPELVEAILAVCESGEAGAYYRLLERRDERQRLFMTLRVLAEFEDRRGKIDELIGNLGWPTFLPEVGRAGFVDELMDLIDRVEAADDVRELTPIDQRQQLATEAEELLERWHRVAEQHMEPEDIARFRSKPGHRPGSTWRLRVDRPPLLDDPIVDSSEHHLTTVFSKLVVDDWFNLERTDEDRWQIHIGDLGVVVTVDRYGQASGVHVDTPSGPAGEQSQPSAFRLVYVRTPDDDRAHIRVLNPHPDLVQVLPIARLWQAGGPWSVLCGQDEESELTEVTNPDVVCRVCKAERTRVEEMIAGARWELARQLAAPDIERAVRAKLAQIPF